MARQPLWLEVLAPKATPLRCALVTAPTGGECVVVDLLRSDSRSMFGRSSMFLSVSMGAVLTCACSDDAEQCNDAVASLAATCGPETSEASRCQVEAYASYCRDGGRPALFAEALDCLRAASGDGLCETFTNVSFNDPQGAAATCIADVYADVDAPRVDAFLGAYNAKCGTAFAASGFIPPLYVLLPDELEQGRACIESAADCAAVAADCFGHQDVLNACVQ